MIMSLMIALACVARHPIVASAAQAIHEARLGAGEVRCLGDGVVEARMTISILSDVPADLACDLFSGDAATLSNVGGGIVVRCEPPAGSPWLFDGGRYFTVSPGQSFIATVRYLPTQETLLIGVFLHARFQRMWEQLSPVFYSPPPIICPQP